MFSTEFPYCRHIRLHYRLIYVNVYMIVKRVTGCLPISAAAAVSKPASTLHHCTPSKNFSVHYCGKASIQFLALLTRDPSILNLTGP